MDKSRDLHVPPLAGCPFAISRWCFEHLVMRRRQQRRQQSFSK